MHGNVVRLEAVAEVGGVCKTDAGGDDAPPELSSDIYDYGIMLTGGSALLRGIDKLFTERTGLKVKVAPRPLDSVCLGILKVIESEGKMGSILQYRGR